MSGRRQKPQTGLPRQAPEITSDEEAAWLKGLLDEIGPHLKDTGHGEIARDLRRFFQSAERRLREYEQRRSEDDTTP